MKTRYVKSVVFNSINDITSIDERVNKAVDELTAKGDKVVSIIANVYGLSPMCLIYSIIYEGEYQGQDDIQKQQ